MSELERLEKIERRQRDSIDVTISQLNRYLYDLSSAVNTGMPVHGDKIIKDLALLIFEDCNFLAQVRDQIAEEEKRD